MARDKLLQDARRRLGQAAAEALGRGVTEQELDALENLVDASSGVEVSSICGHIVSSREKICPVCGINQKCDE